MSVDKNRYQITHGEIPHRDNNQWRMVRPPKIGTLKVVCVSHDYFMAFVHFSYGGTIPCCRGNCSECKHGRERRVREYILAVAAKDGEQVIVELSDQALNSLDAIKKKYGSLREVCMLVGRTGNRERSPHKLEEKGKCKDSAALPAADDIWPILSRVWKLDAFDSQNPVTVTAESTTQAEKDRSAKKIKLPGGKPHRRSLAEPADDRQPDLFDEAAKILNGHDAAQ